jgi:hypothetical protein
MAIIYSYPSESNPQATDLLIGTSTVITDGVKENVTRSYSIQTLTDYIKALGGVGVESIVFTAPLTGGTITQNGTVGITKSSAASDGYLSSTDWSIFSSKLGGATGVQDAITYWNSTSSLGSSSLSEPTGGTTVTSSKTFAPTADASTDIGINATQRWLNLYLSGTASAVNFTGTNLTLTGTLSANGSVGTAGFILQSQAAGAVQWVDLSSAYDTYDLNATANGTDVDMNLTSTSGTDNSVVKLVAGTNVTLTRDTGVQVTINSTDQFQGTVKSVTSADANRITVGGTAVDPTIDANVAAVGSASNNLATGSQIQTAIDTALTSALVYQGGYDAATNTPDLDSATNIAITKGFVYTVTVDGDFFTEAVKIGDTLIAEEDMAINGGSALSKWTTVQSNIDVATATTVGLASFPTGNKGLDITAAGAVSAQTFSAANLTGGYVPDASSLSGNEFLSRDGTFKAGPTTNVSSIATGNGLLGGPITSTGTISPDYTSGNNIILSAADGTSDTLADADDIIFSVGNNVKYGNLSQLKTYIGAGTGTVTGSGTQYKIPFWSNAGGTALGDSMVAQNVGATLLTNTGSFTTTSITDSASSTGTAGQVLTAGAGGGAVTWGAAAASYTDWDATGDNQSPAVPISVTDGFVLKFTGATETAGAGLSTDSAISANEMTIGLINSGGTASATTFYRGDGQWATPPAGTPTRTVDIKTGDGTTVAFTLSVSPTSTAYIDIYIAGVYQQKSSYSLAGAIVTFSTAPPTTITNGIDFVSLT